MKLANGYRSRVSPLRIFILYAYAADRSARPTYVCLPYGLYHAINGRIVARTGTHQEIVALAGIYFFDARRVKPSCEAPEQLPVTNDGPDEPKVASTQPTSQADQTRMREMREEEAREILEPATKNHPEDSPGTRKAAIRTYKYLSAMTVQRKGLIEQAYTEEHIRPIPRKKMLAAFNKVESTIYRCAVSTSFYCLFFTLCLLRASRVSRASPLCAASIRIVLTSVIVSRLYAMCAMRALGARKGFLTKGFVFDYV